MTADKTSPASIPPAQKIKKPSLLTHLLFVIVFPI